jgi:hypothetical protein
MSKKNKTRKKTKKRKDRKGSNFISSCRMPNFKSDGAIFRLQNEIKTLKCQYTVHSLLFTARHTSQLIIQAPCFLFQFALYQPFLNSSG